MRLFSLIAEKKLIRVVVSTIIQYQHVYENAKVLLKSRLIIKSFITINPFTLFRSQRRKVCGMD